MLNITPISLITFKINLGPSVTGIGQIGPKGGHVSAESPTPLVVPRHDLPDSPTIFHLLSWHTEVSKFAGRDEELEELEAWVSSNHAVSVKFMIGEGGVGKSRLAAEFATMLQDRDWAAGFADLRKPRSFPVMKEGTLLVIDYPEENTESVRELLRDLAGMGRGGRFRVLFLTRQPLNDWQEIIHDGNAATIVDMIPVNLGRLPAQAAHKIFCSTQERAAEAYDTVPLPVSEEVLEEWLRQAPENDRALFIMAAISDEIPVRSINELAQDADLQLGLRAGVDIEPDLKSASLLSERAVRAPRPDIFAAAFMGTVFAVKSEIAPELVWAALRDDIAGGIKRLSRLSYDAEIVLGMHEHPISEWLARAVGGAPDRCVVLREFVSWDRLPISLINAAIAVCQTLLPVTETDREKAGLLNNLSVALGASGDRAGALEAIRRAVEIRERLAKKS